MEMHLATIWESIADAVPDSPAISHGEVTRTWAEYTERAARVASALDAAGLGPDSKSALYMYNGTEYLEAQYGCMKTSGVPININYRYLDEELWYLLDNSDSEALFFHSSLGERVARVLPRLPDLKLLVEIDNGEGAGAVPGAVRYNDLIADHEPMAPIERSEDDIYMLYTGGTTGMPKGVMFANGAMSAGLVANGFPLIGVEPPSDAADIAGLVKAAVDAGNQMDSITCAPLMHGTGVLLGAFIPHLAGGHVVTLTSRSLDAHEVLETAERHQISSVTIIGDSFAKPLVRALDEGKSDGSPYDTSSIKVISSSGVMWTAEVKEQLLDRIPQATLVDAMGSTEGSMGTQISMKGMNADTATFAQAPTTKVFMEGDIEVEPGSDDIGMIAASGNVPLGYFKDPEKTAGTFREIGGVRYSFPGDFAKVAADGTLILLGRGSQVINTGGEKVFPEEVEEAVKRVDGVVDCLVVGIDNEKFGQAVTAVVSLDGAATADAAAIISSVKNDLAGFKAPKSVVFVDQVPRSPNGKADYRRAKEYADEAS